MAVFRFRLEKVREHRRRVVDGCSKAVAEAGQRVEGFSRMRERLERDIRRHASHMAARRDEAVSSRDFQTGTAWLVHLNDQAVDLEKMLVQAMEEESAAREELAAAWRDLEVLNRLRTRQETAWRMDLERRERRLMDEIGQRPVARRRGASSSH